MKDKAIRCLLDVVDLPPDNFARPEDGRQRTHLARQRKALVIILAKHANADGTRSYPSTITMAKAMGLSRRTIYRLLEDLRDLGFLNDAGIHSFYKTRIRALDVPKMTPVTSSRETGDILEPSPVTSSPVRVTSSQGAVTKEDVTQPPLVHRPEQPPTPTVLPPPPTTIPKEEPADEAEVEVSEEEQEKLEREAEEAWAKHQEREWKRFLSLIHEKTELRGAVMTRENAAAVRKQAERYDPETVVRAIQDWTKHRSMPLDGLKMPWGAWLREGEPFLRKTDQTLREERRRAQWIADVERSRPYATAMRDKTFPRFEEFLERLEQVDPEAREGMAQNAFKEFSEKWFLPFHRTADRVEEWYKTGNLADYAEE